MRPLWLLALVAPALAAPPAPTADFQRDIRPLLAKKCFACHGPDDSARKANLRLDSFDHAIGAAGGYPGIVPGKSKISRVMIRVADPAKPMPPVGERLNAREIELLRSWIDSGAAYKRHWAFDKPVRAAIPTVSNPQWTKNAIDNFVLANLDKEGWKPAPEADRYVLARRLSLDLTGLPPDPKTVAAFVADKSPEAYEHLVDDLLASPKYGERWARMWLDLARYADTQGYEKDGRRTIWPYRDWVIKAFNDNMRFDRFTLLQLAGDLQPSPTESDLIATGFHRNTMTNTEGGTDDEEFRDLAIKDRVAVTGQVWMGLTWGCAQCHSHKYDPLAHKEFYQLYAFYNQTEDSDKPDDRPTLKLANANTSTLIFRELPTDKRRVSRIHERGNFLNPGAPVEAIVPASFHPLPPGAPANRLGLAQWLTSRDNPLTARVQVNRFWARLFGRGLVESEEDFGTQGSAPANPQLLDWLAVEFMDSGWDIKALLKTIVMSSTYRQSSDATPEQIEKDPYNRMLARGARFRLDAEIVRDQALAASGLLSAKMGGAPVMPWQPDGIWMVVYNSERWETSRGEDRYRRGIYTFLRRSAPYPSMITYDAPTGETCTVRRIRTNTPLQALATLNDPVSMEAAQHLALRAMAEPAKSDQALADRLFRLILIRPPAAPEIKRLVALHDETRRELAAKNGSSHKLLEYDKTLYAEDRLVTLIGDRTKPVEWRYTLDQPTGDWFRPGFDVAKWQTGVMPFGFVPKPDPERPVGTEWKSEHIWMTAEFDAAAGALENLRLLCRNTVSFEAWLNGEQAVTAGLERDGDYEYKVLREAARLLKPGKNTLAISATRNREASGGQYLNARLLGDSPIAFAAKRRDDASRAAWVVVANALLNLDETLTRR